MCRQSDQQQYPPRGMCREEAASYIGVGITKFDEMVFDRRMPQPKEVDGRDVWDRVQLDIAFTDLPTRGGGKNRIDAVLARTVEAEPDLPPASLGDGGSTFQPEAVPYPDTLTPRTLAKEWACSEQTVRALIREGRLPAFKLGSKLFRIRRQDVESFERPPEAAWTSADGRFTEQAAAVPISREERPRPTPLPRLGRDARNGLRPLRHPKLRGRPPEPTERPVLEDVVDTSKTAGVEFIPENGGGADVRLRK